MKRITAKEVQNAVFDNLVDEELIKRIVDTLIYYDNMSGEKFRAPNLGNATLPFLVDELGFTRDEIKPRQTYEKMLSGILKGMRPENNHLEGEDYVLNFNWVSKMIMDGEAIKRFCLNPEEFINSLGHPMTLEDFQKPSEYWEARSSHKDAKDATNTKEGK